VAGLVPSNATSRLSIEVPQNLKSENSFTTTLTYSKAYRFRCDDPNGELRPLTEVIFNKTLIGYQI